MKYWIPEIGIHASGKHEYRYTFATRHEPGLVRGDNSTCRICIVITDYRTFSGGATVGKYGFILVF